MFIKLDIPSDYKAHVVEIMAEKYGYQEILRVAVPDPDSTSGGVKYEDTPNPVSKEEFFDITIESILLQLFKSSEVEKEVKAIQLTKQANVEAVTQTFINEKIASEIEVK